MHPLSLVMDMLAKADDETLVAALHKYHREGLTNNPLISERLAAEYQIVIQATAHSHRPCVNSSNPCIFLLVVIPTVESQLQLLLSLKTHDLDVVL